MRHPCATCATQRLEVMRITPKRSVIWASVTAYILLLFIGLGFALFQQIDGRNLGQITGEKVAVEAEAAILREQVVSLERRVVWLEGWLQVYQELIGEERKDGNTKGLP